MDGDAAEDRDLIARWIRLLPDRPYEDEARLDCPGVPVWALIGYLPAVEGDLARAAADYDIPREAVTAALAYYHRHRAAIDARLAANDARAS